jgi:hypothetical protein
MNINFKNKYLEINDRHYLIRFYLKTDTESSLRNVVFYNINREVFLDKDRAKDNSVHFFIIYVPSQQL